MGIYDNAYAVDNVFGHARSLLEKVGARRGAVHLDFGCGFGRIAEPLRDELGLTYLGLDADPESLRSLAERGFEALPVDLRNLSSVRQATAKILAGRTIGSLSIVDTLEHLPEPTELLEFLRELAGPGNVPLVVSVPNVAHRDIGFKLAFGRWDYTPSGLLDHTHLRCFTESGLDATMRAAGWHETARLDVALEQSDQHFPRLHPALARATSLHRLLAGFRSAVDGTEATNQFVRAYLPGHPLAVSPPIGWGSEPAVPFLTVVTRTQGRRLNLLREVILCLSAQTDQDFELIVVGHRLDTQQQLGVERILADTHERMRSKIRFLRVESGNRTAPLNAGFAGARGRYVSILDDDDVVFAHWVETFKKLATAFPGRMLRSRPVSQTAEPVSPALGSASVRAVTGFEQRYPAEFELLDHLIENRTPGLALAFPRSAFAELHIHFDDELTTTEDWDFLLRVASVCDVASSPSITCVYRRWKNAESSATEHASDEWRANYEHICRKLDRLPIILPHGAASRIRALLKREREAILATPPQDEGAALTVRDIAAIRERARVILSSRSWQITAPLRFPATIAGRHAPQLSAIWTMTPNEVESFVRTLERSWSWRLTGMIRGTKRLLARTAHLR
jgi:hypothetical protein